MIRWITPSLATARHESVPADGGLARLDVRDLVDKEGNPVARVAAKIEEGTRLLAGGRKVVVVCDYGMSRSNAIAAGILARAERIALDEAVLRVMSATGEKALRIEVLEVVRRSLGEGRTPQRATAARSFVVTGGGGFVGRRVVERLARSHRVAAPRHADLDLAVDAVGLDALVRATDADTVVHLAKTPVSTTGASMGAALTMLKTAADVCLTNGAHLVIASGWEVFSGHHGPILADESTPVRPGGTYGQTEVLCETLVGLAAERGLAATILRSSPAYGPGGDRPKFLLSFIDKARRGETIVTHRFADGFPTLDLVHVDDLAGALAAAAERRPGGVVHVGTGRGISTAEAARRIAARLRSTSRVEHADVEGSAPHVVMNVARAATALGWKPTMDFDAGLETLIGETSAARDSRA